MTKRKSTKRALLLSALSLLMCVSMLIGTTFAWFTDSVTSGRNIIQAGNLDVELKYAKVVNGTLTAWDTVAGKDNIFDKNALWEPGRVEVVYLEVSNLGSLALKYQLGVNVFKETPGTNVFDEEFKLSDYLVFKTVILDNETQVGKFADRELAKAEAGTTTGLKDYNGKTTELLKGEKDYVALIVYMPESVGNKANYKTGTQAPQIELGINLFATQYTAESDSFGSDYDEEATHEEFKVTTANDLQNALNNAKPGDVIKLENNIELTEPAMVPEAPATFARRSTPAPIVIDLNGSELSVAEDKRTTTYAIANMGNVVLKDSVGGGSVNSRGIYNGYTPDGTIYPNATMTILNGVYNALGTNGGAAIFNYGTVAVKGGTFTSVGGYSLNNQAGASMTVEAGVTANNGIYCSNATLTVNGGEFTGNRSGCHVLYSWNTQVTINGGSFYNYNSGNATLMAAGNSVMTVNGGTIGIKDGRVPGNGNTWTSCLTDTSDSAKLVVNGGTFNGGVRVQAGTTMTINGGSFNDCYGSNYNINGTVTVNGGAYTDDAAANFAKKYLAEGYSAIENANGTYDVLKGDVAASDNAALNEALKNGEKDIALGKGEFTMPGTSGDVTISGTTDTKITVTTQTAQNVTLNGVTVVAGSYKGIQHSNKVVFENCVLKGSQFLYANEVIIKNCVIDLTETADYIWTYSAKNVTFDGCTFNTLGKAILMYNEGPDLVTNVTVKNCTFNATESALASGAVAAAIEIGSSIAVNGHYTLTTENNIVDPDFSGEWRIKNSAKDNTTVNGVIYNRVADGLYKGTDATYYVYNANGLEKLNAMMADKSAGRGYTVNLLADIDFAGKTWTAVDSHVDWNCYLKEFNGNGYTISNLTINGQAMFRQFAGSGDVVIKDITFDKATVNSNALNTSILTVQSYQNVLLDNVDVKNSSITGTYKVAPLIATVYNENPSTITATLRNCDVSNTVVTCTWYDFCTAGMVAFVYEGNNDKVVFENCTVTNVKLFAKPNGYTSHAWVYVNDADTDDCFNEVEGVTVTGCTFEALK